MPVRNLKLRDVNGEPYGVPIRASVFGAWAVHQALGGVPGYAITHVETGACLPPRLIGLDLTETEAIRVALALDREIGGHVVAAGWYGQIIEAICGKALDRSTW